jgi:hypothetical protein
LVTTLPPRDVDENAEASRPKKAGCMSVVSGVSGTCHDHIGARQRQQFIGRPTC